MAAENPDQLPTEAKKNRGGLLRSLQRISSSPSILQWRPRPSTVGNSYDIKASLSWASLSSSSSSSSSTSSSSASPSAALGSGSPCVESSGSHANVNNTGAGQASPAGGIEDRLASSLQTCDPGHNAVDAVAGIGQQSQGVVQRSEQRQRPLNFWGDMPPEIMIRIFSYLKPRELVCASQVCAAFYRVCFDGQLWTTFDASEFYNEIPHQSLTRIIVRAAPFVRDLILRGCVQIEDYRTAEAIVRACKNVVNANLEGCAKMAPGSVHVLLANNPRLRTLNLTGLEEVKNRSCKTIAAFCPRLETLNVSWCKNMDTTGIQEIVKHCRQLKDLRASEIKGFGRQSVAWTIFKTNGLERLTLSGCADLTDDALRIMMHGVDPDTDHMDRPAVPVRKLRHLDLSRCTALTDAGLRSLEHLVPDLQGLALSGCHRLTDAALQLVLATAPRLSHLELDDQTELTNGLLSDHLAESPCAARLRHLSLSRCEKVGDAGVLPLLKKCVGLRSLDLDNTRISDLVLAEAAFMVNKRSTRTADPASRPVATLHMSVYDCANVSWTGVREILFRNALVRYAGSPSQPLYPTETIALNAYYGWQMTIDEHMKRVLRGDLAAASRLECKWGDWMQANSEAGAGAGAGAGARRRRRRAREAQMAAADEEGDGTVGGGGGGSGIGRRRARTMTSCVVM